MAWRYYLQRALTDVWLDREAQLEQVDISWVLTGPGSMTAHIPADLALAVGIDGRPLFDVWSTIVYAEKDGEIRWGGLLNAMNDAENGEKDLTFISFSGYPKGRIYTGEYRLYQADAFDIIRYIWNWIQFDPFGDLGVILSSGLSGVTIGTEDPGPRPVQAEGESLTAFQNRLLSWQTLRNEPYELAWWNTPDCGSEIDQLLTEAGAEYVEVHLWANEEKTAVSHQIFMFRPGAVIQPPVDPTVAPAITSTWDQVNVGMSGANGHGIGGMTTSYVADEWMLAVTFDTGDPNLWWQYKLVGVNKNTGEKTRESAGFGRYESTIAGIVAYAGYFAVMRSYSRVPGTWDGWFIDYWDSNLNYIRSTFINNLPPPTQVKPAFGFNYIENQFMVAYADGANSTLQFYTDLSAGASINVGSVDVINTFANIGNSAIGYVARGNFDFGGGRIIYGISGNNMFVCTLGGDRLGDSQRFRRAEDAWVSGGTWDGSNFYTINNLGVISKYSSLKEGHEGPVTATYTWYDDNALGGTHETKPSPIGNGNIVRRAWNRITTPQPPEAWNVFSNDAAKKARVYLSNSASVARRQAATIHQSPWLVAVTNTDYSAGTLEPTTNTFSGLDLNSYPVGARRFDLRFVEGENIVVPPLPTSDGEAYANYVVAVGAGEERHTLREDAARIDGRLRRDAVVPLKDTYSPSLLKLTAQVYLDRVQNIMTFDTLEVFDHPNAPVGSWQLGDEIFVQTHSTSEKIHSWAKVIGWSFNPDDENIAQITVLRLI